jgi:hypothetical protein
VAIVPAMHPTVGFLTPKRKLMTKTMTKTLLIYSS